MAMCVMRRDIQGAASGQPGDGRERVQLTAPYVENLRVGSMRLLPIFDK